MIRKGTGTSVLFRKIVKNGVQNSDSCPISYPEPAFPGRAGNANGSGTIPISYPEPTFPDRAGNANFPRCQEMLALGTRLIHASTDYRRFFLKLLHVRMCFSWKLMSERTFQSFSRWLSVLFPITSIDTTFHHERIVSSFTANGEKFKYVEVYYVTLTS